MTREEEGGLPTAPSTQGLRGDASDTQKMGGCAVIMRTATVNEWTKVELTRAQKLLLIALLKLEFTFTSPSI